MDELVLALVLSLILTEVFECGFTLAAGKRGRSLLLCALVNLVTNPPVVLLSRLAGGGWLTVGALEVLAILVEWLLYRYSGLYKKPFLFSLTANVLSFSLGLMINQLL